MRYQELNGTERNGTERNVIDSTRQFTRGTVLKTDLCAAETQKAGHSPPVKSFDSTCQLVEQ